MYRLGQSFNTVDPAKALQNEHGVFEVVSPKGETLRLECHAGASIASITTLENPGEWKITKIAELTEAPLKAHSASAGR